MCLGSLKSPIGDPHHIDQMLLEYQTLTQGEGFEKTVTYQTDAMVPLVIGIIPLAFDVADVDLPGGTNCGFWQTEHMPNILGLDLEDSDFAEQEDSQNYALSIRLSETVNGTAGIQQATSLHDVTATWYAVADADT